MRRCINMSTFYNYSCEVVKPLVTRIETTGIVSDDSTDSTLVIKFKDDTFREICHMIEERREETWFSISLQPCCDSTHILPACGLYLDYMEYILGDDKMIIYKDSMRPKSLYASSIKKYTLIAISIGKEAVIHTNK